MNTFLRYIEVNGMKNEKIESLPASELDHFLSKFVWTHGGKRRRIRAGDSFQFSSQYKLTAILRRNTHLTSQGQWVRKIRKVLAAKRKSLVLTWARQRKQTESCSAHRRRRRGCPFFLILNSATPVQLRLKELCGSFYTTLRSPSKRISVKRSVTVFHRSSFYRCKLNIVSIGRCTFQIFHGNVKIVQYEMKRRIVIDSDEDDWLWSYVCQLHPVPNLDFHLTLTWSIFQSRKYCLIDKKNRSSNFRINNCFCEIPLQSVFEVLFKLV